MSFLIVMSLWIVSDIVAFRIQESRRRRDTKILLALYEGRTYDRRP